MKHCNAIALVTFLAAVSTPVLANESAATTPAATSYQAPAQSIDCRRAPGRALAMLRDSMNPCNRDGLPQHAPKPTTAAHVAESAKPAQSPVTASPAETPAQPARVDRSDCPMTASQPEKRPRHMLFLHLS